MPLHATVNPPVIPSIFRISPRPNDEVRVVSHLGPHEVHDRRDERGWRVAQMVAVGTVGREAAGTVAAQAPAN